MNSIFGNLFAASKVSTPDQQSGGAALRECLEIAIFEMKIGKRRGSEHRHRQASPRADFREITVHIEVAEHRAGDEFEDDRFSSMRSTDACRSVTTNKKLTAIP